MKYLYKGIWNMFFRIHLVVIKVLYPIVKWGYSLRYAPDNTKADEWKSTFNNALLEFPGGIFDWYAFSSVYAITLTPIVISIIYFKLEVFSNTNFTIAFIVLIGLLVYYIIFYRNIDWLTEHINEIKNKANKNNII